jgi:hypothetical protein
VRSAGEAGQRFVPDQGTGRQRDDRLERRHDAVRVVEDGLDLDPWRAGRPMELRPVEPRVVATLGLGRVHGGVGLRDDSVDLQRPALPRACLDVRDADARSRRHGRPAEVDRAAQRPAQGLGHLQRPVCVADVVDHDPELVPTEPRDGVAGRERAGEPSRRRDEQGVAGCMTESVVDGLEAVEVDEQDARARPPASRSRDGLLEPVVEQGAVGEPGELVVEGAVRELLGELLLLGHVAGVPDQTADGVVVEQVAAQALQHAGPPVAVEHREGHRHTELAARGETVHRLAHDGAVGSDGDGRKRASLPVARRDAEQTLDGRADVADPPVGVGHHGDIGGLLDQGLEPVGLRTELLEKLADPSLRAADVARETRELVRTVERGHRRTVPVGHCAEAAGDESEVASRRPVERDEEVGHQRKGESTRRQGTSSVVRQLLDALRERAVQALDGKGAQDGDGLEQLDRMADALESAGTRAGVERQAARPP